MIWLILGIIPAGTHAQSLTEASQQALNTQVTFINTSVKGATRVMESLKEYYDQVDYIKKHPSSPLRQYRCSNQLPEYEYKQAVEKSEVMGEAKAKIIAKTKLAWKALEKLDEDCKNLEVYIRLEDYKKDEFSQFERLLKDMEDDFEDVRKAQQNLYDEVNRHYRKLQVYNSANAYQRLEKEMQAAIAHEKEVLANWQFHFQDNVATGFPLDKLIQSVNESDKKTAMFFNTDKKGIEYPASSAAGSFGEALKSLQQVKKDAIDGFTFEAKQSDVYSNQVYLDLLNYFNNDLIVSYNSFINYSKQTGQRLLFYNEILPVFKIKKEAQTFAASNQPFEDKPLIAFTAKKQNVSISAGNFTALNAYIEFINESVRSVNHLQNQLRFYDIHLSSFEEEKKLNYLHEKFSIPLSYYQSAVNSATDFPDNYRISIRTQTEVLLGILKEMDQLGIELALHTKSLAYKKDNFERVSQIRDRYKYLFDNFDLKKEQLYADVKKIFDSYKVAEPSNSWNVAGKALLETVELDKEVVLGVKSYIKGEKQMLPATDQLEASIRSVIANEYKNMKGIERIGRNNGLCPYNPYEDIPTHSKTLAAQAQQVNKQNTYSRPYESFMYLYNDIVYDYNKFAELSKTPILKNISQPDMFIFKQPYQPQVTVNTTKPTNNYPKPDKNASSQPVVSVGASPEKTDKITVYDTVKVVNVQKVETVKWDTVYIEKNKVDTVYIHTDEGDKDFLSMKGYATNNMVLLLDVSSSMAAPQKLPLLKQSIKLLLQIMRPEDEIAIVVYSGEAKVALPPTSAKETTKIYKVIDKLHSDGATNGNEGIKMAYKVASKNFKKGGNNRIILASDGEFAVNSEVSDLISQQSAANIQLSVFDFGNSTSSAKTLQSLAVKGKGEYEHITRENSDISLIRQAKAKLKEVK